MGGHLVEKQDDAYQDDKGLATDLMAPGRVDGKPEAQLCPDRADPEAEAVQEHEARVSSVLHAAAYTARTGCLQLAGGSALSLTEKVDMARTACRTTTEHLVRVIDDIRTANTVGDAFGDAYANVVLLLDAVDQLTTAVSEAAELRELIGAIKPPKEFRRPTSLDAARSIAGAAVRHEDDRMDVVVHQLNAATELMADSIASYRVDWDADADAKLAGLGTPAAIAADTARYAERAISDPILGLDDCSAPLAAAIVDFVQTSQRLVYWAMTGEVQVKGPCDVLAAAVAPIAARVGLPALEVVSARTREQIDNLDTPSDLLRLAWTTFFTAQRDALKELAERDEPKQKPSWREALVEALCLAAFAGLGGGIGVALGEAFAETKFGEYFIRGAVKKFADTLGKTITQHAQTTTGNPRRDFFHAQAFAILDAAEQTQESVVSFAIEEAKRAKNGGEILQKMHDRLQDSAASVGAAMAKRGVQAWATYLAQAEWGRDDESKGTDMTGLGQGIGKLQPDVAGNPNLEFKSSLRPAGVLELHVSLDGSPRVEDAIIHGLRKDDAGELTSVRIGELAMPVQLYVHSTYARIKLGNIEMTSPTHAVVSRNETGGLWLREANKAGRISLAGYVEHGDDTKDEDVLRGASVLWDLISNDHVPEVDP